MTAMNDMTAATSSAGRVGLWLVGGRGSVATTAVAGLAAICSDLADHTGLVTELPALRGNGLVAWDDLVVGGHDVTAVPVQRRAEQLAAAGVLPVGLPLACADRLAAYEARLRPGYVAGLADQREQIDRLVCDLADFTRAEQLDRVVVVNVASTEPAVPDATLALSLPALEADWSAGRAPLPSSSVYAAAAFEAGAAFVDFTPSTGARVPALAELALSRGVPWAGSDGKTGETLLKSVLAPMFTRRALRVRSWAGTNLLGGGDGATLADPAARASKVASKATGLHAMLGYKVDGPVHIDFVEDLGEWKTAWDHVSFEGFLGTRMTLQFTWQGCDSALAAPLVLDLARLAALALERGESGPLRELAFFFKDPVSASEHGLAEQWHELTAWARGDAVGARA